MKNKKTKRNTRARAQCKVDRFPDEFSSVQGGGGKNNIIIVRPNNIIIVVIYILLSFRVSRSERTAREYVLKWSVGILYIILCSMISTHTYIYIKCDNVSGVFDDPPPLTRVDY